MPNLNANDFMNQLGRRTNPSPPVDYNTVNYNELERNVVNATKALKGFLTQKSYDTNFMSRISTTQFSRFASDFARSTKTVERLLIEHRLYDQLGVSPIHLDEQRNNRQREERRVSNPYADLAVSSQQIRDYQDFLAQNFESARGVGIPVSGIGNSSSPRRRRRSENDMLLSVIKGEDFPKPQFVNWQSERELREIINDWYSNIEYKEQWIFSRREREGFNRRNVGQFSLEEVQEKLRKRKNNSHPLDTTKSQIYDWKLGGTDWLLRLELVEVDKEEHGLMHYLICRYVHKPTNKEVKYDVRYWTGSKFNSLLNLWSQWQDNERSVTNTLASLPDYEDEIPEPMDDEEMMNIFNPFADTQVQETPRYTVGATTGFYGYYSGDDSDDDMDSDDYDEDNEEYENDEGDTF
jgi:hypothetical protein